LARVATRSYLSPERVRSRLIESDNRMARRGCPPCFSIYILAPFLLLVGIIGMLTKEVQNACKARTVSLGEDSVEEVGCDSSSAGDGSLVMFTCDLVGNNLTYTLGDDWHVPFVGVCMNISTEYYRYKRVEKMGNCKNGKCEKWEELEFGYFPINYSRSSGLPHNKVKHVDSAAVGSFIVPWESYLEEIDCNAAPVWPTKTPEAFHAISPSSHIFSDSKNPPGDDEERPNANAKRVRFVGNDMTETTVTVLGRNNGGVIEPWESPPSRFCSSSEFTLVGLKMGKADKELFFGSLADENHGEAMSIRFISLLMISLGLGSCSGCQKGTPCFRIFILPIVPASGCILLIFGVIRMLLQPDFIDLIGISAIGASFCILALTICFIRRERKDESAGEQTCQV